MRKKRNFANWPRPFMQWSVILAIVIVALIPKFNDAFVPDFEAYCPFGGIQALGSYILNQALSCSMTSAQIVMGLLLMLAVFLLSKLFCAYICPIGTISEWLGKLGDKLKIRWTIGGIADKALRSLKYILLFITLYFTFQSNELFCKKFDPYFGIASGFDSDVVVLYAVISILLVIVGSVFIRLFWCKYVCPLGAISNIFRFTGFFVAVMIVYLLLLNFGIAVHYVWPLTVACAGGYFIEVTGKYGKVFPLVKITRNEANCTGCQLCSIKCPQAIDVANVKVVRDTDCNLCNDCVSACPEEGALLINQKKSLRWLSPIATIVLIVVGILLGKLWEVPTIDQKWYSEEEMSKAKVFNQSGLQNIKCFGSSMAFAAKMKETDGVMGVATFVKHKRVKIYYDPDKLDETEIQELLFTPSIKILRTLKKEINEVVEIQVWLENFFDLYDFDLLSRLLQEKTEAICVASEYDCPVSIKIYFPESITIDKKELTDLLETKTFTYREDEITHTAKTGYRVAKGPFFNTMEKDQYLLLLFEPYEIQFNDFGSYTPPVVRTMHLPMGENYTNRDKLSYLVSHLSNDSGIVEFRTFINDSLEETIAISYIDTITNQDAILMKLASDTLCFTYDSGRTGEIANMFNFKKEK